MTTTSNGQTFVTANSFSELTHSPLDAKLEVESALAHYSVRGASIINLSSISGPPNIVSKEDTYGYKTEKLDIPPLLAYKLHDARVFPAHIQSGEGPWHLYSQLVIDKANDLSSEPNGVTIGGQILTQGLLSSDTETEKLTVNASTQRLPILEGNYLFLGSLRNQFENFLVHGLSKLWILQHFGGQNISSLKLIIDKSALAPLASKILEYLGINKSQIIILDSPCIVEEVIVPAPAYRTGFWLRECVNYVYDNIASSALKENNKEFPKKVFLSRTNKAARKLSNEIELESFYRDAGYWIFRPEDLPIGDQIRVIANADCVAGCIGSNMYLSAFQKPGSTNHIFSPCDFNLKDNAILSNVRKTKLTYILGTTVENGQWSVDASAACNILKL